MTAPVTHPVQSPRSAPGFGLVETLVGAAIISMVLIGLVQVAALTFRLVDESSLKLRAAFLAEEGLEAVRTLRDTSFQANIAPLAPCTPYFLSLAGSTWRLGTAATGPVDGIFERRVRIEAVMRDSSDDIVGASCALAASDPATRKVSVDVSWKNRGRSATTTISTYLTDLFHN